MTTHSSTAAGCRALRACAVAVALAVTASVWPRPAGAQVPFNGGTASGWLGVATSEARQGEATLWNPALLALPDVTGPTFSAPAVRLFGGGAPLNLPATGTFAWGALRHQVPAAAASRLASVAGMGALDTRSEASVFWGGFSSDNLGFSATTDAVLSATVPANVFRTLARSSAATPGSGAPEGNLDFSMTTTLALGEGAYVGALPLLGPTWIGASAKIMIVNQRSIGQVRQADAAGVQSVLGFEDPEGATDPARSAFVWDQFEIRGAFIGGADLGAAFAPHPNLLVSVTAANLYESGRFRAGHFQLHQVWDLGQDDGRLRSDHAPFDLTNIPDEVRPTIDRLASTSHFPRLLRGAASLDLGTARIGVAGATNMEEGTAIGIDATPRWSAAVALPKWSLAPRVSVGQRFDETWSARLGAERFHCGNRTSLEVEGRFHGTPGVGIALSRSFGESRCVR